MKTEITKLEFGVMGCPALIQQIFGKRDLAITRICGATVKEDKIYLRF